MPAPSVLLGAAGYDPKAQGARCDSCPLSDCRSNPKEPTRPVPPLFSPFPIAVVVCESPSYVEVYKGVPLRGKVGMRFASELAAVGLPTRRLHVLYRIACDPGSQRAKKTMARAATCCAPRYAADLARAQASASTLPILLTGKQYTTETLTTFETKLARGMIVQGASAAASAGVMVLPHPTFAFFRDPPQSVLFRAGLQRFARWVLGPRVLPPWPHVELYPNDAALAALRAMGPRVAWDVETLGVDPLVDPISCIGLSDGTHTVSLPWSSYTNRYGFVLGLRDYEELGRACEAEIKSVLESNRMLITQNGNYDLGAMRKTGINARNDVDIMHSYSILWPEPPKNLEAIGVHVLPDLPARWKSIFRNGNDDDGKTDNSVYIDSREEILRMYNACDAWVTVMAEAVLQKGLG